MTRTIHDLQAVLEDTSARAPGNDDRMPAVRRKIRRSARRRLAVNAAVSIAVLATVGVAVPRLTDRGPETVPAAGESGPLPARYFGMPRIAAQSYFEAGKMVHLRFTPTGRNTAIVIQCPPGFNAWQKAGNSSASGDCQRNRLLPGQVTLSEPRGGYLPPGEPVDLEAAVVPIRDLDRVTLSESVQPWEGKRMTLGQYLATNPVGKATWSIAVYSGTCKGSDCP
ncbi:hypothetical protein GCM10023196_056200 [Actinoallomurus vinaceus]|uniref:Rieske domain-containing protein n=1 Tax=Actinoallomurus vinaceus TaxID=1080074 RepID=A0ABP8UF89_9ACTN